jgi:hypothetical protein
MDSKKFDQYLKLAKKDLEMKGFEDGRKGPDFSFERIACDLGIILVSAYLISSLLTGSITPWNCLEKKIKNFSEKKLEEHEVNAYNFFNEAYFFYNK